MAELNLDASTAAANEVPLGTEDVFAQRWRERFARLKWLLFSFKGRLGRGAFFLSGFLVYLVGFAVILIVASFLQTGLTTIANPFETSSFNSDLFTVGLVVAVPFFIWMNLALVFKRLHDFGASQAIFFVMMLVSMIPYIGGLIVFAWQLTPGDSGPNQYGEGPGWALRKPVAIEETPGQRPSVLRLT